LNAEGVGKRSDRKEKYMSQIAGVFVHPATRERVQTYNGFSWPCFFCGCFWYVVKSMWGMGILAFLLAFVSFGLSWLVFPFVANDQYRKSLVRDGYVPEERLAAVTAPHLDGSIADELRKLAELKGSGVLTEVEFDKRKTRLLTT
jgi:hypothetical protein